MGGFSTDAGSDDDLSAYERLRLESIRRNREEIEKLGIQDVKASLVASSSTKAQEASVSGCKVVKAKARKRSTDKVKQLE